MRNIEFSIHPYNGERYLKFEGGYSNCYDGRYSMEKVLEDVKTFLYSKKLKEEYKKVLKEVFLYIFSNNKGNSYEVFKNLVYSHIDAIETTKDFIEVLALIDGDIYNFDDWRVIRDDPYFPYLKMYFIQSYYWTLNREEINTKKIDIPKTKTGLKKISKKIDEAYMEMTMAKLALEEIKRCKAILIDNDEDKEYYENQLHAAQWSYDRANYLHFNRVCGGEDFYQKIIPSILNFIKKHNIEFIKKHKTKIQFPIRMNNNHMFLYVKDGIFYTKPHLDTSIRVAECAYPEKHSYLWPIFKFSYNLYFYSIHKNEEILIYPNISQETLLYIYWWFYEPRDLYLF